MGQSHGELELAVQKGKNILDGWNSLRTGADIKMGEVCLKGFKETWMKQEISTRELEGYLLYRKCLRESLAPEECQGQILEGH